MTAYVQLSSDTLSVTATFGTRQNHPEPAGYAELSDDDSRFVAYLLAGRRIAVCDAVSAQRDALFARGCPYLSKRVQVDDSSRANIASMVVTAMLANAGTIPWPNSISVGWISLDNTRIPLAAPADGITLGATVCGWYATARQNSRALKDAALASDNPESIDITTGWPAG